MGRIQRLGEAAEPRLAGAAQQSELEHLETEHDNLRAVLAWILSPGGDATLGLRWRAPRALFWSACGYPGEGWALGLLSAWPLRRTRRRCARQGLVRRRCAGTRAGRLCCSACSVAGTATRAELRLGHRPGASQPCSTTSGACGASRATTTALGAFDRGESRVAPRPRRPPGHRVVAQQPGPRVPPTGRLRAGAPCRYEESLAIDRQIR